MKQCYDCGTSFNHQGETVDDHPFCSSACSGKYIQRVTVWEQSDGPKKASSKK
jgi:hypothetical protein